MDEPQRPSILIKTLQTTSSNDPKKSVNFYSHGTKRVYHQDDAPTKLKNEITVRIKDKEGAGTVLKSPERIALPEATKPLNKPQTSVHLSEILDCICCFPLLIYVSLINLLCPCIKHIMWRAKEEWASRKSMNSNEFIDLKFPPNNDSLNLNACAYDNEVEWLNITNIYTNKCRLNLDDINIQNMIDGQQQDHHKWLLSVVISLCDYPYLIKKLFLQKRANDECNKFRIKLYDGRMKKKVQIVIDDMIPCNKRTKNPIFNHPKSDENWFILLEKSMAKLCGSYGDLSHGDIPWALETLTGRKVKVYLNTSSQKREPWTEGCIKYTNRDHPSTQTLKQHQLHFDDDAKKYFNHKQLWYLLNAVHQKGGLIIAARAVHNVFENISEMNHIEIVSNDSYSISQMKEIGRFRLIQVNNRWNYKCNETYKWQQHPEFIDTLQPDLHRTDKFWIELNEFVSIFNVICVCNRLIRKDDEKNDIILDMDNNASVRKTSSVCCKKCFSFWCKCGSCKIMYPKLWSKYKGNRYISSK